ncbi:DUF4179 domain-containing protein [Saccharibacillus deserti]|uniref:DUF4179 domain-containing protein n=1 Tax=Saccharibacillus deserti TaxID=1634444 RepID=UPI00155583D0|nr:DUF4179 domain-containing protein [Saccharibacillus deserti]
MPNPLSWDEQEMDELQRKIRNHPAPVNLVESTLSRCREEEERPERAGHRFVKTKIMAAVVAAMVILFGSSYVSPAVAASLKQIPGVSSLFRFANDLGLRTADERGLVIQNDSESTHEGITLKAPVALFDGTRVSVGVEREFEEAARRSGSLLEQIESWELSIDGQQDLQKYAPGSVMSKSGDADSAILEVSDLKNQGGQPFPDRFELTVRVRLDGIAERFELKVPVQRTTEPNLSFETSASAQNEDLIFKVKKVELTPVTTQITTESTFTDAGTAQKEQATFAYDVLDEQGRKLQTISGGGQPLDGATMVMDTRFEPFLATPKKIVIKPFRYVYQSGGDGLFALDEAGNPKKNYLPGLDLEIEVGSSAAQ